MFWNRITGPSNAGCAQANIFVHSGEPGIRSPAMKRYMNGPVAYFAKALAAPKARDVVEQIFLGTARMAEDPRIPAGCLMVQGALACRDASVRKEVAAR